MSADPTILAARARAAASKARLDASIAQAKARLNPKTIASEAVGSASEKASQVAHSGLQAARERPALTAAAVGAVGLLLANKPIRGWIASLVGPADETGDDDAS